MLSISIEDNFRWMLVVLNSYKHIIDTIDELFMGQWRDVEVQQPFIAVSDTRYLMSCWVKHDDAEVLCFSTLWLLANAMTWCFLLLCFCFLWLFFLLQEGSDSLTCEAVNAALRMYNSPREFWWPLQPHTLLLSLQNYFVPSHLLLGRPPFLSTREAWDYHHCVEVKGQRGFSSARLINWPLLFRCLLTQLTQFAP